MAWCRARRRKFTQKRIKAKADYFTWYRLAPMFHVQDSLYIDERDLTFSMIRAQGAGGQNVNKVSSAVHLRFDVRASRLPPEVQDALCAISDHRISKEGVIVIKS